MTNKVAQQKDFFKPNNNMEKTIKQRIMEISNELRISKEGRNKFQEFNYFKPDDILKALIPLLIKNELYIQFKLEMIGTNNEYYRGLLYIYDFKNETKYETFIFDIDKAVVKGANGSQNSGATLTYGKRYSLMNAFNIADNTADFDSNEATERRINSELNKAKEDLLECESLDSLKTTWLLLSKETQKELKDFKEDCKAKLIKKTGVESILPEEKKQ